MRGRCYPAQLMGMNDGWRDVLIEHYNRVWVSGGDGGALRLDVITPPLHAGDQVIFGKYAGSEVEVDGKDLKIMRESDILAVVGK